MKTVELEQIPSQITRLIADFGAGEDVIVTQDDKMIAKLVPVENEETRPSSKPHPQFGSAKGKIWLSEDFDEPLEDFKDYM